MIDPPEDTWMRCDCATHQDLPVTDHCYDSTQLNDFRRCPEFYNNRHIKGLVLDGGNKHSNPLAAGSAIHKGVEAWFSTGDSEKAINAVKATWGEDDLFLPEKVKYTQGFLAAIMAGYTEAWPRENDSFKVLVNEQWMPWGNYGGIIDRLVEFEDGVYVMDTKTTGGWVNERYIESFQLSSQFRGYVWLAKRAGHDCQGAYLDAVHLDTRYHKVKASDFVREKILFSEEQIEAWVQDRDSTMLRANYMRSSVTLERWPQNDQRCFDWNRPCPYWRLCTAVIPENEMDYYKEERWEPWTRK
ncbi:hypothetical protein LCGC14_2346610 [marine sediment metagenome]|uniref:PD-(D/E)XK endonuclease-like domain-containing protein n=1 Tax=marine sediment metagenome TaxID=412755 RepID=A0A0F9F5K3_9ZZZZ